jgi:hypothetical protein
MSSVAWRIAKEGLERWNGSRSLRSKSLGEMAELLSLDLADFKPGDRTDETSDRDSSATTM